MNVANKSVQVENYYTMYFCDVQLIVIHSIILAFYRMVSYIAYGKCFPMLFNLLNSFNHSLKRKKMISG